MKSNCLLWSIKTWLKEGGYILIRKSNFYFGPHFLHGKIDPETKEFKIKHFVPKNPKSKITPPFLFDGEIKDHD